MQTAVKSLLALTAADLMTTPVKTIPQEMTLREAANLLSRSDIRGAPVVDAGGRCVGVLSSADFVTLAVRGEPPQEKGRATKFIAPWGDWVDIDDSPDCAIAQFMTAHPITVEPTTPIGELAQKMVSAHVHRLLVVVDRGGPRGIVSSTDILAAVARAARRTGQEG